jgi:radical SAM protein with 4Fe4S-binding SPASM domain
MRLGIILVHGYSGSNYDLKPLADKLTAHFGEDSVINLLLPGHACTPAQENIPEFNESLFCGIIHQTIATCKKEDRKIILIGHSTGGSLALSTLLEYSIIPDLLILVSVPKKIDSGYFVRWDSHRAGKKNISMVDVAMMVKLINRTGAQRFETEFPVLVIQGEKDRLVLSTESHAWKNEGFGSARVVTIPEADHDLFKSINCHLATDIIRRAVADIALSACKDSNIINSLIAVEPEFKDFFKAAPFSENHLALCPSGQSVIDQKPELSMTAKTDPVIANIEITTFCNLHCQFCARSQLKKFNKHMSFELFRNILAVLPNTYKIVLVGLGETLLHPQLVEFIQYTKSLGKKTGIVTNAMLLNKAVSEQLLSAGLDSIAFSIDGSDADLSSVVRKGTDFHKVIRNIKQFVQIANSCQISKAVFSAVSTDTVLHLKGLIDTVSDLGVDVLMLSDINFKANLDHTLWQNADEQMETAVKQAISHAFAKKLPVLSVHGLEEFGLEKRYHDFLMIPPAELYQRSKHHSWCFSPWQTIPVDVDGNITLCDCQPDFVVGNLFQDSFSDIWNGETLKKYRTEMLSKNPPEACQICPRF